MSEEERQRLGGKEEEQELLVVGGRSVKKEYEGSEGKGEGMEGDGKLIFIYLLLTIVLVSMAYFNYQIYLKYSAHHSLIQNSLESTKSAAQSRQEYILSSIDNFTQDYADKFSAFEGRFAQLGAKLQEMKSESQFKLDEIQLLSIKNAEQMSTLNEITRLQGIYAQEIKEFHSGVDTDRATPSDPYFSIGQDQQDYPRIQSIVWAFTEDYSKQDQYLRKLYLNNVKYYSYLSDFSLKLINQDNYFYFLPQDTLKQVTDILAKLKKRMSSSERTNLGDHFETIKKTVIMISLLQQHGGIAIIDNVAFTEPLGWVNNLQILKEFSHDNPHFPPQVVAFNNKYYSSTKVQLDLDFLKEMYQFPDLERFCIAAVKKSPLITEMLKEMIRILDKPHLIKQQIEKGNYDMGLLRGQDPYYEFYYIAGQMVLQKKQRELDKTASVKKLYAVDFYGLFSINTMAGPMKLHNYFKKQPLAFKAINILDIPRKELEDKLGAVRFMHFFNNYDDANRIMLNIKNGNSKALKGSFVHEVYLQVANASKYLYERNEHFDAGRNKNKGWDNLPKKVWVYDHTQSKDLVCKLMIPIIAKANKGVGLEVHSISKKSIESFISPSIVKEVNEVFSKSRLSKYSSLRDYILLLCLLSSEGGIFLDSSYLLMQDLQWVYKINEIPGQMISNRFGQLPQMLMFHNNHQRKVFNFTFDPQLHTRVDSHLAYDPTFIAVAEGSQLVDEWIEELLKSLSLSANDLDKKFLECGLRNEANYRQNIESLPIDLLRCLYLRGLRKLKKEEYDRSHYKLWSIDGDYNIFKLGESTNYEDVDHGRNLYTLRYSQEETEKRLGKFLKLTKLDPQNLEQVNSAYIDRERANFRNIHRQSLFAKYFIEKL